jgi:hypothetical protein
MGAAAGDARQYLLGVDSYARARAFSARRSVTEDGEELTVNLGAQDPAPRRPAGQAGDAGEALARAKEATRR